MIRKILSKLTYYNEFTLFGVFNAMRIAKIYNIIVKPFAYQKKWSLLKNFRPYIKENSNSIELIEKGYSFYDFSSDLNFLNKVEEFVKNQDINFKNKKFMSNILEINKPSEFLDLLIKFSLDDSILNPVIGYLGFIPKLTAIKILISVPNKGKLKSSQLLHLDTADTPGNHCKVFINLENTSVDNGAFAFLDSDSSSYLIEKTNYGKPGINYRISDSTFNKILTKKRLIHCEGNHCSGLFIDTSRCFHMGSRVKKGDRKILMLQFTSPNKSSFKKDLEIKFSDKSLYNNLSKIQKFVVK